MGDQFARLLLRVVLGVLLLFHGVYKILHGVGPITGMVTQAGLPPFVAYGVFLGEVVAPVLLILGVWTRAAALVVLGNMLFALGLVHTADFLKLAKTGGWALELQAFYFFVALAVMLLGAGRYSMAGPGGRWN